MCLIHDFGETLTGDIPAFLKTQENEKYEKKAIEELIASLPDNTKKNCLYFLKR